MVLRIDLGGPALEFIRVPDPKWSALYAAEIDGVRVPIRRRRRTTNVGMSGESSFSDWEQADTALLWEIPEILRVGDYHVEREGDLVIVTYDHQYHYNAFEKARIEITFRDGVLVYDADVTSQNDSYY